MSERVSHGGTTRMHQPRMLHILSLFISQKSGLRGTRDVYRPGGQYSDETRPSTKKKVPSAGSKTCIGSQMRSYMMSNSPSIWHGGELELGCRLWMHKLPGRDTYKSKNWCVCICIYIYMYTYVRVCVCACVLYMYTYTYIYI